VKAIRISRSISRLNGHRMARGVPSTVFLPFCFPLRRNSPVGQRSGVRLQPCGKGRRRRLSQPGWRRLQNRAWLGSTPAIASHRIRISGTDTCRRSCRASPSAKVHLTSESAELRTRVDGTDRKPTRRIRTGANPPRVDARPSVRLPRTENDGRNAGNALRPILP